MNILTKNSLQAIARYYRDATLTEGVLRNTNERFRCLFIENTDLRRYIELRTYREPPSVSKVGKIWIPSLRKTLNSFSGSIDMCIAVLPRKYRFNIDGYKLFKTQPLVCSEIDVSQGWKIVKTMLRRDKRQFANKMDRAPSFSHEISNNREDFDLFYREMYVPHVRKRFADLADIDPYDGMRKMFQKGFLLFITENDRKVAGVLCTIRDNILYSQRTGILHGDEALMRRGVASAEYYFTLRFAVEYGIDRVNFMRSRPFLNDGVFGTKRKWGAKVYPDDESRVDVLFIIPENSRKAAAFFDLNPSIVIEDSKMYGLLGWTDEKYPDIKQRIKMRQAYHSRGLSGLVLIQPTRSSTVYVISGERDRIVEPVSKENLI
ncbi:MAG: hypothetical protein ACYDHW_07635 [Syntrophorhabdaceae bacterium]